jgi:uncharacterized protein YqeY
MSAERENIKTANRIPARLRRVAGGTPAVPANHLRGNDRGNQVRYIVRGGKFSMSLKQQIISDLTASMKAQDAARTSTLRMVKAAVMNREIEKGSEMDDEEMMKLLRSLVKQRRDSVEQYEKGGRPELAAKETTEIDVIEAYLPQAASREEIEAAIAGAITETGASSIKDMGKVMKAAQAALAGKNADGRTVSELVKAKLGG